jgi:hypothetical protein
MFIAPASRIKTKLEIDWVYKHWAPNGARTLAQFFAALPPDVRKGSAFSG